MTDIVQLRNDDITGGDANKKPATEFSRPTSLVH